MLAGGGGGGEPRCTTDVGAAHAAPSESVSSELTSLDLELVASSGSWPAAMRADKKTQSFTFLFVFKNVRISAKQMVRLFVSACRIQV